MQTLDSNDLDAVTGGIWSNGGGRFGFGGIYGGYGSRFAYGGGLGGGIYPLLQMQQMQMMQQATLANQGMNPATMAALCACIMATRNA